MQIVSPPRKQNKKNHSRKVIPIINKQFRWKQPIYIVISALDAVLLPYSDYTH